MPFSSTPFFEDDTGATGPVAGQVAARYADVAGWVMTPIARGRKGPAKRDWGARERCVVPPDWAGNIGLVHAYSGTCAVDIDDVALAGLWLREEGVDLDALFAAPDAVQITSGRAGRAKLLYSLMFPLASCKRVALWEDGKFHDTLNFRCAPAHGRGAAVQDVLPPSIHPDTGKPYQWGGAGHWSRLPALPEALWRVWDGLVGGSISDGRPGWRPGGRAAAARVAGAGTGEGAGVEGESERERAVQALQALDPDMDRDEWVRVGMALQAAGGTWEDYDEWSSRGDKYQGPEDTRVRWDSFKPGAGIGPGTLYRMALDSGWVPPRPRPEEMFGQETTVPPPALAGGAKAGAGMDAAGSREDGVMGDLFAVPGDVDRGEAVERIKKLMRLSKGGKDSPPTVRPLVCNVEVALTQGCGLIYPSVHFNELAIRNEVRPAAGAGADVGVTATDEIVNRLHSRLTADFEAAFGKDTVYTQLAVQARQHHYHPVRDYLQGVRWDGAPRVEDWLPRLLGADDTPYSRAVGWLLLCGAVQRAMRPGSKFDYMTVLEGEQGERKSSLVAAMVPNEDWYADTGIDPHNLDKTAEKIAGKWIVEIGELKGLRRTDVEAVKQFLTHTRDRYRMAYGRLAEDHPRQCVFIGTTNQDQYLEDVTGNRRFLPIKCGAIDVEGFIAERDQLWAEAAAMMSQAASAFALFPDIERIAKAEQADRRVPDPWEDSIHEYLRKRNRVHTVEIACAMGVPPNEHTSALFQRVARAMKTLHEWEGPKDVKSDSIQEGVKGVNRKGYARKGDPHTLILAAYNPEPAPAQGFAWSVPGVPDPLV